MKAYNRADAVWVYTPQPHSISASKMKPLQHPDVFHVEAARGWLDLGNSEEAQLELAKIKGRNREHPEVLEVVWQICARRSEWEQCVELAGKVIQTAPEHVNGYIHKAYALHELKRTQEAWDLLFPVAEKFPKDPTVKYNLACYGTQLGRLWEAEQWIKLAFTVGNEKDLRTMALQDPDLKALWPKILGM
jgi:uncharacterized protein HemY